MSCAVIIVFLTSARILTMSVNLSSVQKWIKEVDSLGEWVWYDKTGRTVMRIFCALCANHKDRLHALRNFSFSFVDGISSTALKKDNVNKHQRSDMHAMAVNLERKPTVMEIYRSTPLGRALATASQEQTAHVCKLFEVAYMSAKEEIPFTKYPTMLELKKKHSVSLGIAYVTEHKYRDFTL